jgi:hypothetical protein
VEFSSWPIQYGFWLTRREALLKAQGIARRPSFELAANA